ncbi:MAG: hypothetical protein JNK26_05105 [Candidatus Doudnabacteria bacterium]|nr:hypothetical protein [Candidatus Doudnabacteria bacterium]
MVYTYYIHHLFVTNHAYRLPSETISAPLAEVLQGVSQLRLQPENCTHNPVRADNPNVQKYVTQLLNGNAAAFQELFAIMDSRGAKFVELTGPNQETLLGIQFPIHGTESSLIFDLQNLTSTGKQNPVFTTRPSRMLLASAHGIFDLTTLFPPSEPSGIELVIRRHCRNGRAGYGYDNKTLGIGRMPTERDDLALIFHEAGHAWLKNNTNIEQLSAETCELRKHIQTHHTKPAEMTDTDFLRLLSFIKWEELTANTVAQVLVDITTRTDPSLAYNYSREETPLATLQSYDRRCGVEVIRICNELGLNPRDYFIFEEILQEIQRKAADSENNNPKSNIEYLQSITTRLNEALGALQQYNDDPQAHTWQLKTVEKSGLSSRRVTHKYLNHLGEHKLSKTTFERLNEVERTYTDYFLKDGLHIRVTNMRDCTTLEWIVASDTEGEEVLISIFCIDGIARLELIHFPTGEITMEKLEKSNPQLSGERTTLTQHHNSLNIPLEQLSSQYINPLIAAIEAEIPGQASLVQEALVVEELVEA